MDMLNLLAQEYDDGAWNRYAGCFENVTTQISDIPQDIVNAVFAILGESVGYKWLYTEHPKLGGKNAAELVQTEEGERALKAFIMRLPN